MGDCLLDIKFDHCIKKFNHIFKTSNVRIFTSEKHMLTITVITLQIQCRILHCKNVKEVKSHSSSIFEHFQEYGSPIMMGIYFK